VQIDAHDEGPVLLRHLGQPLPAGNAGVGAEDVQTAESLDRLRDEAVVLVGTRDVCAYEDRAPPELLDLGDPSCGLLVMPQIVDRNIGPALGESQGDPAADATVPGSTGDERDLSLQG
jgi:hypothetical protein